MTRRPLIPYCHDENPICPKCGFEIKGDPEVYEECGEKFFICFMCEEEIPAKIIGK